MPLSNRQEFQLFGIFGFPLAHTLSPVMQEAACRDLHLKAFYLPFEIDRREFRDLMRSSKNILLDGFNVTVPYKEDILGFLDELSPSAKAIGAVNTVVRKGNKWTGFNTDELGFITSLEREGKFRSRGKEILILGAGGSARAVAYGLARCGVKKIVLANRTIAKARKIAMEYQKLFPRVEFKVIPLQSLSVVANSPKAGEAISKPGLLRPFLGKGRLKESLLVLTPVASGLRRRKVPPRNDHGIDLVVNATSVGLRPSDPTLVPPKLFHKKALFVDLIYNPRQTEFLRLAKKSGHRTLNGLGMLVYQGAEAFRLWTGRKAPVKVMKEALIKQ